MGNGAGTQKSQSDVESSVRSGCLAVLPPDFDGPMLLSADVGGTSSRLHLFLPPGPNEKSSLLVPPERKIFECKYKNNKFESFSEIVGSFLKDCPVRKTPLLACFAVAGVVVENSATFVNLGWTIRGDQLQQDHNIKRVVLINDFAAQGFGMLTLNPRKDCDILQDVPPKDGAPRAVLGAGTGLGECFLTTGSNADYEVWPTEGGHAEFAPRQDGSSKLEFEMIQYLQIKFSAKARISVERIVSGRGLGNIYEFLAWKYPERVNKVVHRRFIGPVEGPRTFDPAAITDAANNGECELCKQAVTMWCSAYGAEAGVVGLTYMPFGGLYVTGGVTNKLRSWILGDPKHGCHGPFMEAFLDKGRVTPMLMRIPVYLVRGEDMGERGAMLKAMRLYAEHSWGRKKSTLKWESMEE
mmetsp:Transcript_11568/g.24365  ORF Transcript_11568/g.24365 Transcript_11568/m.24365 type:complete len:411 (-) Transcript_11568:157-1389(-)